MNIVIINASDTFESRVTFLYQWLKKQKCNVQVITSDYMHIEKKRRISENKDFIFLKTVEYQKNLSLRRLYSHDRFAKEAYRYIKDMDIDVLYIVVPPNSQAKLAGSYKKRKRNVKIIIDIIDLWPESFPIRQTNAFPFILWANIRNKSLQYADIILTECNLYRDVLQRFLTNKEVYTVYWTHDSHERKICSILDDTKFNLCYLGSVNNIIDIPKIGEIIKTMGCVKPVVLKIIGTGEKMKELIRVARNAGAEVVYYGKIYDAEKKQQIFNTCHYGLNIMKECVCVGLSMKSIDYFEAGLPIINNLRGDTAELIETYQCGMNWDGSVKEYAEDMRRKSRQVFESYFNKASLERKYNELFKCLLRENG